MQVSARVWGNQNLHTLLVLMAALENTAFSQKVKHRLTSGLSSSTPRHTLKRKKAYIYTKVCTQLLKGALIQNCQNVETTQMSINKWINKHCTCIQWKTIHQHKEGSTYISSQKHEWTSEKHHTQRKATYYIDPCIRNNQNRPIYKNRNQISE